jgi:integrase
VKAKAKAEYLGFMGLLSNEDPRFSEWSERWLEGKIAQVKAGVLKEATVEGYRQKRKRMLKFIGSLNLSKIRPDHLDQAYRTLLEEGLASGYVNSIHRTTANCLRAAFKNGLIQRDVAAMADAPSASKSRPYVLSRKEWGSLIRASRVEESGIPVEVILKTGMRVDVEALSLTWRQVDFTEGTITVGDTKTEAGTGRVIPLDASLVQRLRVHYVEHAKTKMASGAEWNPEGLVFCSRSGNRASLTNFRRRTFLRVKRRADVSESLTLRDLRHNCGSYLLSEGVPITMVSKILGHANPAITMSVYAHELREDAQQVREAMARIVV